MDSRLFGGLIGFVCVLWVLFIYPFINSGICVCILRFDKAEVSQVKGQRLTGVPECADPTAINRDATAVDGFQVEVTLHIVYVCTCTCSYTVWCK